MRFLLWKGAELNFHRRTAAVRHTFHCHQQWTDTANAVNSLHNTKTKQTDISTKTQGRASKNKTNTHVRSHRFTRVPCQHTQNNYFPVFSVFSLQMFDGPCKTKPVKTVFLTSRNSLPSWKCLRSRVPLKLSVSNTNVQNEVYATKHRFEYSESVPCFTLASRVLLRPHCCEVGSYHVRGEHGLTYGSFRNLHHDN